MLPGRLVSIQNRFTMFDGNKPHAVEAFQGRRISIVFFTRKEWLTMSQEQTQRLREYGFPIPPETLAQRCTSTDLSAAVASILRFVLFRCLCLLV